MSEPLDAPDGGEVAESPPVRPGRPTAVSPTGGVRAGRGPARRIAPGADSEGKLLTVPRAIALSGRIASCEKLIVEGSVETDLEGCRELEVARTGTFRGNVDVEIADVAGTLEGSVIARNILIVRATGTVRGDVAYGAIEIERGATVAGGMRSLPEEGPPAGGGPG